MLAKTFPKELHSEEPRFNPLFEFVELVESMDTEKLADLPVFLDCASRFSDSIWRLGDVVPGVRYKNACEFDFTMLNERPTLLFQAKVIVYLWLNFESKTKISSKASRFIAFKSALKFLIQQNAVCLSELQQPMLLNEFFEQLAVQRQSSSTIENKIIALIKASHFDQLLPFQIGLSKLTVQDTLKEITHKEKGQTLAIPPRLMTHIYSQSLELIEEAFNVKDELSTIKESELEIYQKAKELIDSKVESNVWKWLQRSKFTSQAAYQKKLTEEVSRAARAGRKELYETRIQCLPVKQFKIDSYCGWLEYKRQLINSCLLVAQAFSGMRSSELLSIEVDGWFSTERDGETVYQVLADSYKFIKGGAKKVSFVVAPVVFKALELAKTLTETERSTLKYFESPHKNYLWLSQNKLSRQPVPIRNRGLNSRYCSLVSHLNADIHQDDLNELRIVNPGADIKLSPGEQWPISSHQLRRTFAVYVRRHNLAYTHDIKHQFKHVSLAMAAHYSKGARDLAFKDFNPQTTGADNNIIAYWPPNTFETTVELSDCSGLFSQKSSQTLVGHCMSASTCHSGILSTSSVSSGLKSWAQERLDTVGEHYEQANSGSLRQHLKKVQEVLLKLVEK
ncbi:MAG: hypothetical protein MK192_08040 [Idiomarina sp.]|nr:hypothetical protein [Idiomarina sp.]